MSKYQAYPEYKDSGVEWLGDIPEHWVVAELKRYSRVQGGYAFSSDSFVDSGIPVIRIGDIKQDGTISLESCKYIKDEVSTQYKDFEVRSGDLLMAMTGATIGKAGWFKGSQRALLNQRVGSFKYNKSFLNYKFFWYVLNSLGYQEYIRITAFGGAQPNISDTGMVSYQSAIPDLIEQEKIANFLNHETAKIDTLIDKQQQLIQLLKEKRQAVISRAVTKGLNPNAPMRDSGVEWLGKVPEHWEVKQLKFLSTYNDETLSDSVNKNYEFEYVDIGSVSATEGIIKTETMLFKDAPSRARRVVRDGDVIISTVRTYLEAISPILNPPNNLVVSTGFAVIRPDKLLNNGYAAYCLRATGFIKEVVSHSVGISYPAINATDLVSIKIPAPPLDEQVQIADYLNEVTIKIDILNKKAQSVIELIQERRTALISAAVTGKIDVRHHVSRPTGNDTSEVSA